MSWPPCNLNAEQHYLLLRRKICPIVVFHFKKEGDPEQAVEFEGGWHGGKVVLELHPALALSST